MNKKINCWFIFIFKSSYYFFLYLSQLL